MKKWSLSEWASIAEVIGAAAVVVSLVYVGIQVRENTEEIRAANRQQLVGRAHTATNNVAMSPTLAGAFAKVGAGEPLSPAEQVQYGFFVRAMLYDVQEAFLLHREGGLDDAYWGTRSALIREYLTKPQARDIYRRDHALGVLHEDFVTWVDESIIE